MDEIAYGSDPRHVIGAFHNNPAHAEFPAIVFIHGGAWVDESNSYNDWTVMAKYISRILPSRNMYGLNYRLLPGVLHPAHMQDIYCALDYLRTNLKCCLFVLVGHLVGATLAIQMFMPTCNPPLPIKHMILLDGIFSVCTLVKEYPEYDSFVSRAFLLATDIDQATPLCADSMGLGLNPPKITILYSLEDELLSPVQTNVFIAYLEHMNIDYGYFKGNWGRHDEMIRHKAVCTLVADII